MRVLARQTPIYSTEMFCIIVFHLCYSKLCTFNEGWCSAYIHSFRFEIFALEVWCLKEVLFHPRKIREFIDCDTLSNKDIEGRICRFGPQSRQTLKDRGDKYWKRAKLLAVMGTGNGCVLQSYKCKMKSNLFFIICAYAYVQKLEFIQNTHSGENIWFDILLIEIRFCMHKYICAISNHINNINDFLLSEVVFIRFSLSLGEYWIASDFRKCVEYKAVPKFSV